MQTAKVLRIDRGLGLYHPEFQDRYAILGLPIHAPSDRIRRRYLAIAKQLHPDVFGRTAEEKNKATFYLSKLVNPAYSVLSQERERLEYLEVMRLIAKHTIQKGIKVTPHCTAAKKLLHLPSLTLYENAVEDIAKQQYRVLDDVMAHLGHLSELNLVYVLAKEGYQPFTEREESAADQRTTAAAKGGSDVSAKGAGAIACLRRARQHIDRQEWAAALPELRQALTLDPQNSDGHALQGVVYWHQKLAGPAKKSFQKALEINPNQAIAKEWYARIEKMGMTKTPPAAGKPPENPTPANKTPNNPPNAGQGTPKPEGQKSGFWGWGGKS
ncbi:MAG TPA: J domain-containing protein [Cyanobacteria bacterium UBA8156]|jgi:curved DNA-binding protein CbpA|nr:J domain-containing protein [Cyanobacteria bacterium UBA8156]